MKNLRKLKTKTHYHKEMYEDKDSLYPIVEFLIIEEENSNFIIEFYIPNTHSNRKRIILHKELEEYMSRGTRFAKIKKIKNNYFINKNYHFFTQQSEVEDYLDNLAKKFKTIIF
jgi:uncharacterized protein YeeX (DUF496 family)